MAQDWSELFIVAEAPGDGGADAPPAAADAPDVRRAGLLRRLREVGALLGLAGSLSPGGRTRPA